MKRSKLEELTIKYLTRTISKKEWSELNAWFEKFNKDRTFQEYLEINYAIEYNMSEFNTRRTKDSVLKKIKKDKKAIYRFKVIQVFKYAAIFICLLGIGYFYQQDFFSNNRDEFDLPSAEEITLELESGAMKVFSEGETNQIVNEKGVLIGTQKGNRLTYIGTQDQSEKLLYNQLTVPYGKRFELEFSDGTIAHLNAGSRLKYPIRFLEGQDREVFMVGEVFFDVVKDANRPFIVNTSNNLDINVLGTKFNVSNYPEDEVTEVVLVEGSVGLQVDNETKATILEPGYLGSFDRDQKNIVTTPVLTGIYTSWMQGSLVFRNMTFENILKKLERQYNVTIENENTKFAYKKFNANFGDEPIETILNYFNKTYGIEYTIENKNVIIK